MPAATEEVVDVGETGAVRSGRLGTGSRPPRGPLLLVGILVTAVAAAVLATVDLPSGLAPPNTTLQAPAVPESLPPWPAHMATWRVRGEVSPCQELGVGACYVRLAWRDARTWAMGVSADQLFDNGGLWRIAFEGVHYQVRDGVVEVLEGAPRPLFDGCRDLLDAYREGEVVAVEEDGSVLRLTGRAGSARCLRGIPLSMEGPAGSWSSLILDLGVPDPRELRQGLVHGRTSPELPACSHGATAFSASPAGSWLERLAAASGRQVSPAGSALGITSEVLTADRLVMGWVTQDEPGWLFSEMRPTRIVPLVMGHEALEPAVISFPIEGVRVWLAAPQAFASNRVVLEHVAGDLRRLAASLIRAAEDLGFDGLEPVGRGGLAPEGYPASPRLDPARLPEDLGLEESGPGLFARSERWLMSAVPAVAVPDPGAYLREADLPDGSAVWSAVGESRVLLTLAGGAVFSVNPLVPGIDEPELYATLQVFAEAANRCPWLGMAAQP